MTRSARAVELVGPAGAAQELDEPAGGAGAHLGHLDLDAVGALEQQLERGDGLDLDARDLAGLGEVGGDAALGEARQRELAADEGGHRQADESEGRRAASAAEARGRRSAGLWAAELARARRRGAPARGRAGEPPGHREAALGDPPAGAAIPRPEREPDGRAGDRGRDGRPRPARWRRCARSPCARRRSRRTPAGPRARASATRRRSRGRRARRSSRGRTRARRSRDGVGVGSGGGRRGGDAPAPSAR